MLKTFPKGGIHPPENKFSARKPVEALSLPTMVTIPLVDKLRIDDPTELFMISYIDFSKGEVLL